jgi:hypothetical protein
MDKAHQKAAAKMSQELGAKHGSFDGPLFGTAGMRASSKTPCGSRQSKDNAVRCSRYRTTELALYIRRIGSRPYA